MPTSVAILLSSLLAGLVGSIPFSLLIARWAGGIDLRQHGSGNVGATNVARTMGAKWGIVALLCDALKGALPTLLFPCLLPVASEQQIHQQVLCGVLAVLGHMFPPWLGFRGGKGVATGLGVVMVLAPLASLVAAALFFITFACTRIVSLSSIIASLSFALTQFLLRGAELWTEQTWSLGLFSFAVPLLILIRHRTNVQRLLRGEEPRLVLGSKNRQQNSQEAP